MNRLRNVILRAHGPSVLVTTAIAFQRVSQHYQWTYQERWTISAVAAFSFEEKSCNT